MIAGMDSAKPERLSRRDAAHWHMGTPANPMVIGALLLFERQLTLEALEALLRDKLIPHRRFRQHVVEARLRWGRPRWIDDAPFNLRAHVCRLSPPGAVDGAGLCELVGERMNAPLPAGRSPWCFELVDLSPRGSALLFRIHHCIADGRALVALLEQLADESFGSDAEPSPVQGSPGKAHRRGGLLGLLRGLSLLFPSASDPASFLRRPLTGRKCVAWSEAIPLDTIKEIASRQQHHVADVLLAGVAGALDIYARARGQVPRAVHALLPVAASSNGSADALGNHYGSVFVSLPAAVDNPQARLELVARKTAALRTGLLSRMAIALMSLAGCLAPGLERRAARWGARRATLVVASLAGPRTSLHLARQLLGAVAIWSPAPVSIGLSCTLFGYAGAIRLGVLADSAVIDDPQRLVSAFAVAIDELRRGGHAVNRR